MQIEEGLELRRRWAKKGNPPCDHPQLAREYVRGANTGDVVCTTCGKSGLRRDFQT